MILELFPVFDRLGLSNLSDLLLETSQRSAIMHVLSTLLSLGLLAQATLGAYTLHDDYGSSDSFFDKFKFYTVCQ